jgi:serine/threonine protein kinase
LWVVSAALKPGDVIDGVYVLERLLGQGGMGAVYAAREERLGRRVAIKVLLDAVADRPDLVKRFEREARSAAALQSDHVTRVLSVGKLPSGAPFIVMELLEGEDLASTLAARGRLAVAEVVGYMSQVCEALAEAHALGIVHRDLKPANIFLARRPTGATTVKVLDFGISKGATGAAPESLTATSAFMGTPYYMSPEQLREAKAVDARSDIWALGVVMYELLTGRPPFMADVLADLCVLIVDAKPTPVSAYRPDVTPALDAVLARCLEKDPAHRFASVKELMVALSLAASPTAPSAPAQRPVARTAPMSEGLMPTLPLPRTSEPRPSHGTVPLERGSEPRPAHGTVPLARGSEPRHLAVHAATNDPVSSTPTWLAPRPNRLIGVMVFAAALAVGSVVLFLVLRAPGGPVAATGETADAGEAADATARVPASTAASTSVPPASSASARPPRATVLLPVVPASAPALPAPAQPPPALPVPVAAPAPSARPVRPPAEPGSLMPGTRN